MNYDWMYPRPDFDRSQEWASLNGEWSFRPDADDVGSDESWFKPSNVTWDATILVPFPWESRLSGVGMEWMPIGWYFRRVDVPTDWREGRTILNFGAVSHFCSVWVNGAYVGCHEGGYLPFSFDITDEISGPAFDLVFRAENPIDKLRFPHGKQKSLPPDDYNDCAFTACSGAWQSIWIERRPATFISSMSMRPTEALDGIVLCVGLEGPELAHSSLRIEIEGEKAMEIEVEGRASVCATIAIGSPRLWSPSDPQLYKVGLSLRSSDGVDCVGSYTGLRRIVVREGRLFLNGSELFVRGALDQGFWPDSGYRSPGDGALRRDVELALGAGFNLVRKHLKLEDPRWLYWADTLGLLVWEELPSMGRFDQEAAKRFEAQIAPMVERDGSHPCIVVWGLYNEEWGLDWRVSESEERALAVRRAYDKLALIDHSRPIVDNSGWWHVKTDLVDWHYYDEDMAEWMKVSKRLAEEERAWFGHKLSSSRWYETQLSIPGADHTGLPLLNGEYGGGHAENQGWLYRWQTQDMRRHERFSGYIYTELFDVEYETVGIYTAARLLKDFGFDPRIVNDETVICVDIVPIGIEVDYRAKGGRVAFSVRISHHGSSRIEGALCWGWDTGGVAGRSSPIEVVPHRVSSPVAVGANVPPDRLGGILRLRFESVAGNVYAENFIRVERA